MSEDEEKKQITKDQYLQAVGLMTLATQHRKIVEECVVALGKTLGEVPSSGGWYDEANDQVYSDASVEILLERLNLEVAE